MACIKRIISVILAFILSLSLFSCGIFASAADPVKAHLIDESEREAEPVRRINSLPLVAFTTRVGEPLEKRLDELFLIVVGGQQPDFSDIKENDKVKAVYDSAIEVLNRYIKNDFTEFEKVHALHDYLTSQIKYDAELYLRYLSGSEVNGSNPAFLLSGVFLNKIAVCEGFVKAFMFLCAIEGIYTQEIRGTYNYGGQSILHVWVKVRIDNKWYNIDPTMDSITFYPDSGDPITVVHHGYFLLSDATLLEFGNHVPSDEGFAANEDYPYHENETLFDSDMTMQVNSQDELNAVFRKISKSKRKIGQVELRLNISVAKHPEAIKKAYDKVLNKDFSYIPSNGDYTPFVRYPRGVYVFLIYK